MFKPVDSKVNFPELDEKILKFWKENQIFEKSIDSRPLDKKWTFLDGPPFITGLPHFGTLLVSVAKDVFPRYWTMKGYRVRRVWGWDVHGLPAENKVENKLGIKSKKEIEEKVGIKRFIEECREYVSRSSAEWEWYIDHIGRWVDFKNAYKTMDLSYMETVMWVFKNIYDKGLIYKGFRVILYCPHCATPISNFEVAMDNSYVDVTESASTYKYQLVGQDKTFVLAWSTTPWNKIVTSALAVNPKLDYLKVRQGDEYYILAKSTLKMLKGEPKFETLEEFKGSELVGKKFEPHYDYYKIDEDKKAFEILAGDFVTAEEGTGVVTIAAYGEEDLKLMQSENIQIVLHLDDEGIIKSDVPLFGGLYYLKANKAINQDLAKRGLLYEDKSYTHSVPQCWRCQTRLYYAPKDAWYINVQTLKPELFKNNQNINWFPKHFKYGRFAKSMEAAPDWNISRNRYWGSPVPVWECDCGERYVPGSIAELEELSGQKITDLHRPEIDEIFIKCSKCHQEARRVAEVLDSWVEAGSAPFAERHFPFNKEFKLAEFFPPDFIVEYTGQIRAWFYVLHVISTALYDSNAFKNVAVTGVILGTDGRKMSKNFGNYPDPKELIEKYGGDALRMYLLSSPVMRGEDVSFSNEGVPEVTRGFLLILWNCYKYFVDYATIFGWTCESGGQFDKAKLTTLDRWILSRLTQLALDINLAFENYDSTSITKLIREFVTDDLSTWYIRRSRDRISSNDNQQERNIAMAVLYGVLVTTSKLTAPLCPFISEEIFRNLTGEKSVHLEDYPTGDKSLLDQELNLQMAVVRKLVELGHAQRKTADMKLRQPLAKFNYSAPEKLSDQLAQILQEELNVKEVEFKEKSETLWGELDVRLSAELKIEGQVRDTIRSIQALRKVQGLTLADRIKVTVPVEINSKYHKLILKQTNAVSIDLGKSLSIEVES